MKQLICNTVLLIFLISCNSAIDRNGVSTQIDSLTTPKDSATSYFPFPEYSEVEVKDNKRSLDSFVFGWYSKMLFAMHEPVLFRYQGENEIYRFTLLRSFDNPLTARLQKQGNKIQLSSKMTSGAGGYEPGQIIWDTLLNISSQQMDTLDKLILNSAFWNMPTEVNDGGKDGSEWILEAVNNNKYHWASRWSPTANRHSNFKAICDYILTLSKAPIISYRIY